MHTNIHFVHFSAQPGGIEIKRPLLVSNIKEYCFFSFVIRPLKDKENNVYGGIPIKVTYGSSNNLAYWYLLKYAIKNRKEVFHVFNIGPIALLMLRMAGVKNLIYAIHGTIYWRNWKQQIFKKLVWKLAMYRQYIITSNSVYSGNVFVKNVLKTANPLVIYNPIDSSRYKKLGNKKSKKGDLKIVYAGRLVLGKNLFKWISIAAAINKKYPESRFEIYGDGPLKKSLQEMITEEKLQQVVQLKGFYHRAEEIYQNADILLFLSEYESFGNVIIESILCKTPVIVSAIPSMKEIFQNYPEFLVLLDENLEKNVLLKIEMIELLRQLAINAAEEFRERFSLKQHILKIKNIYASFNS